MSDCIFCKIGRKEIAAKIIYDDRQVVAFEDLNPQAPVHTLIVPKAHFATLNDIGAEQEGLLGHMTLVATKIARDKGLGDTGYRLVMNTLEAAGQSVFHLHLHLLGGRRFVWPPG
jgi:histidine triad (HIT) family protein